MAIVEQVLFNWNHESIADGHVDSNFINYKTPSEYNKWEHNSQTSQSGSKYSVGEKIWFRTPSILTVGSTYTFYIYLKSVSGVSTVNKDHCIELNDRFTGYNNGTKSVSNKYTYDGTRFNFQATIKTANGQNMLIVWWEATNISGASVIIEKMTVEMEAPDIISSVYKGGSKINEIFKNTTAIKEVLSGTKEVYKNYKY